MKCFKKWFSLYPKNNKYLKNDIYNYRNNLFRKIKNVDSISNIFLEILYSNIQ